MTDWRLYTGRTTPPSAEELARAAQRLAKLAAPPWRVFDHLDATRGQTYRPDKEEVEAVNAALYLRRPLLVRGKPGIGKSSLAYAAAQELGLTPVLRWSINSRSTLGEGLYQYDALGRLRDANLEALREKAKGEAAPRASEDVGRYLSLGPLGTALLPRDTPRVLLIDEIDKSDVDLPNDLLHVFEEGQFEIPELVRIAHLNPVVKVMPNDGTSDADRVQVRGGRVRCQAFPLVLLTSNNERDLPPAFFRRCLRLDIKEPAEARLRDIVRSHFAEEARPLPNGNDPEALQALLAQFLKQREAGLMATDQLLNAFFLVAKGGIPTGAERDALVQLILTELSRG
jgi:MoxR-like ATPase